jgi:hypothetical protein
MLILTIAAISFYWLLSLFVLGFTLQIIANSVVFGIATAILLTWGPSLYYAMRGHASAPNMAIVSITTVWMVVWLQRVYSIVFIALERPWWLMNSAVPAFIAFLFGLSGLLVLIAPAFMKGAPRGGLWQLAIASGIGAVFAAGSYYLQISGFDLVILK